MRRRFMLLSAATLCAGCQGSPPESQDWAGLSRIPPAHDTLGDQDTFGAIADLALLAGDLVVVADPLNGRLSLFSDGQLVAQEGSLGEGPNEFRSLGAIERLADDTVTVLDPAASKIILYRVTSADLQRLNEVQLPFTARDFCILGGRIFVAGQHEGSLVHAVALDGSIARSFLPAPAGGPNPLENAIRSVGKLACSESNGIAFAERTFGRVRVVTPAGDVVLEDSIPQFSRTVYESAGGGFRPQLPETGYTHRVDAVTWIGNGLLFNLSRGSTPSNQEPESRWWSASGGWKSDLPPWPRIVHHGPGELHAVVEDPYPVIQMYRLR